MENHSNYRLDFIIEEYRQYLIQTQGVAAGTVRLYVREVRAFLEQNYSSGSVDLNQLRPIDLHQYIVNLGSGYKPKRKSTVSSLRNFFKFAEVTGRSKVSLFKAVPTSGFRHPSQVPKYLTEEQVKLLLSSMGSDIPTHLRNRAIVHCLLNLGLRAGEVAGLKLDDLDWRNDVVLLTSAKGRRHQTLPLPQELKQSLVDYLSRGRPRTRHRQLFISLRPVGRPITAQAVTKVIERALGRAAIQTPSKGAHLLRHTAATHLVQKGGTVKEIADFLRHRSLDTTVVYAKVNFPLLQSAVQPWPEVKQ